MGNPDEWLETIRKCEYLPEQDIKKLCEMVINSTYKHAYFLKRKEARRREGVCVMNLWGEDNGSNN